MSDAQERELFNSLAGCTIVRVEGERPDDDPWGCATLHLDDGRAVQFSSCSCCDGLALTEAPSNA